jgi:dienelactone hydrolase
LRALYWILIASGAVAALFVIAASASTIARYYGWTVTKLESRELSDLLSPYYRVRKPPGNGPFPTALLYSGCDGPKDNVERWAKMLNTEGWAAVIVDSHEPRGYSNLDIWRLICAGQLLQGSERAGDVLVSIADARRMPFVDRDRLVLIGSSHGGWAIMELFAFEQRQQLPFNLASPPDSPTGTSLDGIVGSILLYPYCGRLNRTRRQGWSYPAPALFILASDDAIAPAKACLKVIDDLEARDLPVEVVAFENVTHGFDQQDRSPLSTLEFDAAATEEAMRFGREFLARVAPR